MAYELKEDVDVVYSWSHSKYNKWVQFLRRRNENMETPQSTRARKRPSKKVTGKPTADLSKNKTAETFVNSPFFAKLPESTRTA